MKKKVAQGVVVLLASAAFALNACGDNMKSSDQDDDGSGGSPDGSGGDSDGSGGSDADGGSKATGGKTGSGGSGGSNLGGEAGGGQGGEGGGTQVLTPQEEAELEAEEFCTPLDDWITKTYLTEDGEYFSTGNESSQLVHGLPGDDDIWLSYGPFCALGGPGDDTITIDVGITSATLVGGSGADRFRIALSEADYSIKIADFESGVDQLIIDSGLVIPDTNTPVASNENFDESTVTEPSNGFSIVVKPGDPAEVWLANNYEGIQQYNHLIATIDDYETFSATDFTFADVESNVKPCVEGTTIASATPVVKGWETMAGSGSVGQTSPGTAAGPVEVTTAGADAYIAAVLSTWAETGRECIDVSAFTGVQFDLEATTTDVIFRVGVSAADPSGHCTEGSDCYAHPQTTITPGVGRQVPFSSLKPASWGVMAPFNSKQVIMLLWATTDETSGKTIKVSNVSFY